VAALFFWPTLLVSDRQAATAECLRWLPWPDIGLAAVCMCGYNVAIIAGEHSAWIGALGLAAVLAEFWVVVNSELTADCDQSSPRFEK
jgi:hypothetical protein